MRAIFRLVAAYDALHHFLAPRWPSAALDGRVNLLCVLSQEPRGVAVSDLSDRLLVTRQNVSAVARSRERKLVRRVVDKEDRRVRRIAITDGGAASATPSCPSTSTGSATS